METILVVIYYVDGSIGVEEVEVPIDNKSSLRDLITVNKGVYYLEVA